MLSETSDWTHLSSIFVLFLVLLGTILYVSTVVMLPKKQDNNDWTKELTGTKSSSKVKTSGSLKDIWDTGRGTFGSSSSKKEQSSDKPFGSSYYYAHNNPSSKGGYADGLRMEDYQMNKPRLLSRGGSSVERSVEEETVEDCVETNTSATDKMAPKKVYDSLDGTPISKYLWDDPGDVNNGIATIRIEMLPGRVGGTVVPWKDAKVTDVSAKVVDGGLLVLVESKLGKYHLRLPTLYGEVDEVKPFMKTKRFLVKLYKKKNHLNEKDKSNLRAWPHPYR